MEIPLIDGDGQISPEIVRIIAQEAPVSHPLMREAPDQWFGLRSDP
jgi:hypothetical protein